MTKLEDIKARLLAENTPEKKREKLIKAFIEMKPFKDPCNIPSIPITDEETYNTVVIPNLIRCGAIAKNKLIIGKTYIGDCRNATEATWDGEKFTYMRTKFGCTYPEKINHFEDDNGYDLFVPIKEKTE